MTKNMATTNQKGTYCSNCGSLNTPGRKSCDKCEAALPKGKWEIGNKIALLALLVAAISILVGAYTVYQADRIEHTNIKPLLDFRTVETREGKHSIILRNYGLGPAVIKGVHYYKYDKGILKESEDLGSYLANLPYNAPYSTATIGNHSYIQKDQEMPLAEITSDDLEQKNYSEAQIHEIIKSWRESLNEITIKIAYEDVLGENQTPLDRPTHFPYGWIP